MQQIKSTIRVAENKMQYETFDVGNKSILLNDEEKEEVFKSIDELGLKGQKELIKNQDNRIIPYPIMNITETRVWQEYCPQRRKLEEFSDQIIPVEIINLLKLIKTSHYFDISTATPKEKKTGWIEVWSEVKEQIDPLMVGVLGTSIKYAWGWSSPDEVFYLIARWGHSLKPYEEIIKLAKEKWLNTRKGILSKKIKDSEQGLNTLEEDCTTYFNGGNIAPIF